MSLALAAMMGVSCKFRSIVRFADSVYALFTYMFILNYSMTKCESTFLSNVLRYAKYSYYCFV
jgi:hypothetical protein